MAIQTVLEKLQIKNEKNILVQGLPSSIEKQFIKLPFAKCVTPLLKTRRIDLAILFAISKIQLSCILQDVLPAMQEDSKLWIAYPRVTSKIASDLCRDCDWTIMTSIGFESVSDVILDSTWSAMNFRKVPEHVIKPTFSGVAVTKANMPKTKVMIPEELHSLFRKNKNASEFFESLPLVNKQEYVRWVAEAKIQETRTQRLESVLQKLNTGKKTPGIR